MWLIEEPVPRPGTPRVQAFAFCDEGRGDTLFCADVTDLFPENRVVVCAAPINVFGIFGDSFE